MGKDFMEEALDEISNNIKQTREAVRKGNEALKVANETIEMLLKHIPKVLGPEGAAMCKAAEQILPGDKLIIIRYNPKNDSIYLSVVSGKDTGMEAKEFGSLIKGAVSLATKMVDNDGRITKTGNFAGKIEN